MSIDIRKLYDSDEEEFVGTPPALSEMANTEWWFDKKNCKFYKKISNAAKPSSFWSEYSMVRACLSSKENIDIKIYKLMAFMKQNSVGFSSKRVKSILAENTFIDV
ncbi:hypothetical protein NQ317_017155 [Molorchus minor]|uniref:Uncharacterized protein n=1 Tax=Molorchus minor TaxID=1323400 RepID=A0ABQ9JJD2_9CUCU|nr:hypothetical protein NQ317_017155 [Molorchus minor]